MTKDKIVVGSHSPEEKAKELEDKFIIYYNGSSVDNGRGQRLNAKQCALIAVDEIISACEYNYVESYNTDWWNKVKEAISKL